MAHPAGPASSTFLQAFLDQGWRLHQTLVWVKDAMVLAARSGGSGPVTERLLDAALRCAKRARTETGIGRGPVSSVYAGVSLASKVLGQLGD